MTETVVITGIGILSPFGIGKDVFWRSLIEGRDAVKTIEGFPLDRLSYRRAAQIPDFDAGDFFEAKTRYLLRIENLACVGAALALSDAGLTSESYSPRRCGTAVGTLCGCLRGVLGFNKQVVEQNPRHVDPSLVPFGVMSSLTGSVSIQNNLRGFHVPFASGGTAGFDALDFARIQLQNGTADLVLAGGVEELLPELMELFQVQGLFPTAAGNGNRNRDRSGDQNGCRPRPFDQSRSGFALGEAAVIFALERAPDARRRGARIYAQIEGFGSSFNAGRGAATADASAIQALQSALAEASASPERIGGVFAGASGSIAGDDCERATLQACALRRPTVSAVKSMLGESLGASGAVQLAAAALALHHQVMPPTLHFRSSGSADFDDWIAGHAVERRLESVLVSSVGWDGNNAAAVLGAAVCKKEIAA